jgi:DNA-binding response OmpR family regulator
LDGVELALKVRAERPALPITVITGYAENVQAAQDAELDVVQKPLALEALLARFRAAFPAASRQSGWHFDEVPPVAPRVGGVAGPMPLRSRPIGGRCAVLIHAPVGVPVKC